MSDTPRTDAAAFGTDDESLNRLFGIRELPRYVVPVDFARILERELAAVNADRDVLRADLCAFAVDMERELSASQQEARRLREALEKYRDALSDGPENCSFSKYEEVDEIARESLSSTPAPVQK